MSVPNIFHVVKGFKKEDLKVVAEELGIDVPINSTITVLKELIVSSDDYKNDAEFVKEFLVTTVEERKQQNEYEKEIERQEKEIERQEKEIERQEREKERQFELEKKRLDNELELARVNQRELPSDLIEVSNSRRKYTLPKLQFRQFGGDLKDWLPFWSQFQHIDKDEEIAPEDKFQYLVQATTIGSRAREVVESFPPTGANYSKAVESLKSRFGKDDLLVEVYVRELIKLIVSVQTKGNFSLTSLYDKLESNMRALETLGVTTDKCGSILYPMVESCFPEDFLKAWNRSNVLDTKVEAQERLNKLMQFLKSEVEGEERINLAVAGFGLGKRQDDKPIKRHIGNFNNLRNRVPTTTGLLTTNSTSESKLSCIFCEGKHKSAECFRAQKMNLAERQNVVKEKRCCFACLYPGHSAKTCRTFLRCLICNKKHVPLMCNLLELKNKPEEKIETAPTENGTNLSNFNKRSPRVFLQTLKAKIISENKEKIVRILFDSASHKSYVLQKVAEDMNYKPIKQEKIVHSLFGGISSNEVIHNRYKIIIGSLDGKFKCNFDALDQNLICGKIRPVFEGQWINELKEDKIVLTDIGNNDEDIQVLIGADIMGKLLTGKIKVLSSGLVAVETYLGWTLMGKVPEKATSNENLAMVVTSLFVNEAEISNLWRLDLIGIKDPAEKKARHEIDDETKKYFLETVKINNDGRYEVSLPWADDKSPLPDNFSLARRRLDNTTSKLKEINLFKEYEEIFESWLNEGIIELVPESKVNDYGNYLPHRPVIKLTSSTTPIRPVFDASAKLSNHPSLNQCLECGPNLIELIPDIMLRFREKKIGVIADIRKAFLQISIREEDRDFLRFLWWENLEEKKLRVFRHARVVFGVKSSPFLLASVIEYHIKNSPIYDEDFKNRLLKSFYVDNVVTSVDNRDALENFMSNAKKLMLDGGFDLREWEYSGDHNDSKNETQTHVLGLIWNKSCDTLQVNLSWLNNINTEKVTKRSMLSLVHKVFDPIGYTSPVMLCPKIMLQKSWKIGNNWDEEITGDLREDFLKWFLDLKHLENIQIPRCINFSSLNTSNCSLHTFVDGSKDAYAAVVFLRIENRDSIEVFLLSAKSRVAPLRGTTIPRMELLAAVIGTRLANSIIEVFSLTDIDRYYWSDSTAVIAWIQREENWSVFVRNRVAEIRTLSNISSWKHIPGEENPADLPSRGCKAKYLMASKWWEGPKWLKNPEEYFKFINSSNYCCNEEEVVREHAKTISVLAAIETIDNHNWYYRYFSSYEKIVRLVGWILRFKHNSLNKEHKISGDLTVKEFQEAQFKIFRMIQRESFISDNDGRLNSLQTFKDDHGIIRLKTRIIYRKDEEDFLKPIVLPSKHEVVRRLILFVHKNNCHAGVQMLLNILREKYWILNGRKSVKSLVAKCITCKRYSSKSYETTIAPLPEDRVKDASVFQITGIDMAGPLYLTESKKCWVMIFTCAVYRAVHFELVTSASTDAFLMAFRRFIARRGRCSTVYCDNGTNFVGAANALKKLNWEKIQKYSICEAIQWKFNPPTACWWGGWWERLIRILKDLLRKVLGLASLNYEEMLTVLVDCESVINARPLTYISEDESIKPISPAMFLQEIYESTVPDIDEINQKFLTRRLKYRQSLIKNLRNRFRSEYLGTLIQHKRKHQENHTVSIGDIVLLGSDNKKRINWPLGRIVELLPGRDGHVRLVRVQTAQQLLLRPIQRLFPLEIASDSALHSKISGGLDQNSGQSNKFLGTSNDNNIKFSRAGRRVVAPERLGL